MTSQLQITKKNSFLKNIVILLTIMSCIFTVNANSTLPNFKSEFGDIKGDMPGCAVGIIHDGKLIHEQYYGLSNIQYQIKNDEKTLFNLGSISKHITAAVIFRLEQDGFLNRDDKLIKYYPQGPKWFDDITLGHLIQHKSGLPDYINDQAITSEIFKSLAQTPEVISTLIVGLPISHDQIVQTVINELDKLESPIFNPGTYSSYSNTGYLFLGDIIKIATDKDLKYWANHYIFEKNQLENIFVHDNSSADIKWAATGYIRSPFDRGQYTSLVETLLSFGDTGVITSLQDFTKWMGVLSQANDENSKWNGFLIDYTESSLESTLIGLYDNGLIVDQYKQNTLYTHAGQSLDAMTSNFWVSPEKKIGYVQMCNTIHSKVPSKYKIFKYVDEYLKLKDSVK